MKKNTIIKTMGFVAASVATLFVADVAMAQDLNSVTTQVRGQMPGVADVLSAVAYIAGIGFGIKAALKLKEHNESKGQVPISQPITMAVVAALLLALPSLLSTSKATIFGGGSQSTSLNGGGAIRSIQ